MIVGAMYRQERKVSVDNIVPITYFLADDFGSNVPTWEKIFVDKFVVISCFWAVDCGGVKFQNESEHWWTLQQINFGGIEV